MIDKIEVKGHYDSRRGNDYYLTVTIDGEEFPWNKDLMQVEVPGTRFDESPSVVITLCAKTVDIHHSIDRPLPLPATEPPKGARLVTDVEYTVLQLTTDNFNQVVEWATPERIWGLDAPHPTLFLSTLHGRKQASIGDWITYEPAQGFNVLTKDEAWKRFQI